jgi:hypothetical protein
MTNLSKLCFLRLLSEQVKLYWYILVFKFSQFIYRDKMRLDIVTYVYVSCVLIPFICICWIIFPLVIT